MRALRERAAAAEAASLAPREWQRGEKYFARADAAVAQGKADEAAREFARAAEEYAAAEIAALQAATLESAYAARERARLAKARRYAPQTLRRADAQIEAAEELLARDPYAQADAAKLAAEAEATAVKAAGLAEIAGQKPSTEELLLRQEAALRQLEASAGLAPPRTADSEAAVARLMEEIERLRSSEQQLRADLADSQAFTAALEDEIRNLDAELGGASQERRNWSCGSRNRPERASSSRRPKPCSGLKKPSYFSNRTISWCASSASSFQAVQRNWGPASGVDEQIKSVIEIYPQSLLLVEGHTDSRGSDRINKILSLQRAQTVANYIISQMGVSAARLTAVGYGAERPIANNETEAAAAKTGVSTC